MKDNNDDLLRRVIGYYYENITTEDKEDAVHAWVTDSEWEVLKIVEDF